MASFFSKLFGGRSDRSSGSAASPAKGEAVPYNGFLIRAAPQPKGSQWVLAGVVIKRSGEDEWERTYIRADTFSSRDEAETFSIKKGKQIVDEQGDRLFADGEPQGSA